MKVSIYKVSKGRRDIMVQASPGKGRSPVVLCDVTPGDVVSRLEPLIDAMRRPKGFAQGELSP